MLTAVILLIFTLVLTFAFKKWKRYIAILDKLPECYPTYPLIGTMFAFMGIKRTDIFTKIVELSEKSKPFFKSWVATIPCVHVFKPEHFEIVMKSFLEKSVFYEILHPWLGLGLLTSAGELWHKRRKLLTPAFHFQILEKFMEVFVEKSNHLIVQLDGNVGTIVDVHSYVTHCTLDIICETAMGVPINAMVQTDDKNEEYINAVYEMSEIALIQMMKPWMRVFYHPIFPPGRKLNKVKKTLHDFSNKIIKERKSNVNKRNETLIDRDLCDVFGRKRRISFLDILLEASDGGNNLTDQDIREEVDTFMLEGHDTTTSALCWSLFLLGHHEEIQNEAFEEVNRILQDKKTPTSTAELNEMKYLECVIKETLRLYPSVPLISRKLHEDVTFDGYFVPKNCQVWMHIYNLHRDPKYWDKPDVFDPDRFLPENCENRDPYVYVPFSAGPRNCIGQRFAMLEEKTLLSSIIKNFKFKSTDSIQDNKGSFEVVLRPTLGVKLILERR